MVNEPNTQEVKQSFRPVFGLENLTLNDITDLQDVIVSFCEARGGFFGGGFLPEFKSWDEVIADIQADLAWAQSGKDSGEPYTS